jgi:hypothetical protein
VEAVDEFAGGFGWIEQGFMQRCSHVLVADGRVWLVDPLDVAGVDEQVRAAGSPAGVIQLLDRHERDCATLANRLDVPHHVVPREGVGPFESLTIRMNRRWQEVALWWPALRVLVCADALGTAGYFRLWHGRLGVHPLLRLRRPKQLARLAPEIILCGHGAGVFEDAASALAKCLGSRHVLRA